MPSFADVWCASNDFCSGRWEFKRRLVVLEAVWRFSGRLLVSRRGCSSHYWLRQTIYASGMQPMISDGCVCSGVMEHIFVCGSQPSLFRRLALTASSSKPSLRRVETGMP